MDGYNSTDAPTATPTSSLGDELFHTFNWGVLIAVQLIPLLLFGLIPFVVDRFFPLRLALQSMMTPRYTPSINGFVVGGIVAGCVTTALIYTAHVEGVDDGYYYGEAIPSAFAAVLHLPWLVLMFVFHLRRSAAGVAVVAAILSLISLIYYILDIPYVAVFYLMVTVWMFYIAGWAVYMVRTEGRVALDLGRGTSMKTSSSSNKKGGKNQKYQQLSPHTDDAEELVLHGDGANDAL